MIRHGLSGIAVAAATLSGTLIRQPVATLGALAVTLTGGCYAEEPLGYPTGPGTNSAGTDLETDVNARPDTGVSGQEAEPAESKTAEGGLPCDVDAVLENRCRSCHDGSPLAPMALLTYGDLTAPALSDSTRQVAEVALERMESDADPMPPGTKVTVPAGESSVFRAWLEQGLPEGKCGETEGEGEAPTGTSEPASVVCSSGRHWVEGEDDEEADLDEEGPWMNPGRACISCHLSEEEEPLIQIGGTVFPSHHEADLCYGVDGTTSDARVVITDDSGMSFELPLETTGNFSLSVEARRVEFPIRAKIVANGRERMMATPQHSGDCNACHTEQGSNGAPGRITLP
jgi:hypothetical protein